MRIRNKLKISILSIFAALISFALLFVAVKAGSLTPSGPVGATMHTLEEIYNSIAGTFDSSGQSANANGNMIQQLKYIADNLVVSGNLSWTQSGNDIYNSNSGNVGIGTTTPGVALELGADKSLRLTGGTSFPSSPTEGQIFFRTDTKQLYVYANAKWQADRSTATLIVAASDSQNKEKADYVADGTNDQVEINAAITALPSTGGLVYLLDGTYNIAASVTIAKSNVTLTGSGDSTKLFLANTSNTSVIVVGDGATVYEGVKISGLKIDGNMANNSGFIYAVYFNTNITKSKIENNYIYNTVYDGILINNSGKNLIDSNHIVSAGVSGINIYNYSSDYNVISNNYIEDSGLNSVSGYGISVGRGTNNTISGNILYSNRRHSIGTYDTSYNVINSNTITNSSQAANDTYSDIYLGSNSGAGAYSRYNSVSGNTILSSAANKSKYGIEENEVGSDYNNITSNIITGPVTTGIFAQGPHTTVAGNKTGAAGEGIFDIKSQTGATQTTLTVTQSGTGDIVNLTDNYITSGKGIYLANQESAFTGNALEMDVASDQLEYSYFYNGTTYTDNTTEANSSGGTAFTLLGDITDDITYFGNSATFDTLNFDISTAAASATLVWEYCSTLTTGACSAWTALTATDGTTGFTIDGKVTWTDPGALWLTGTVNSVSAKWLRVRATALTGTPTANYSTISMFTGKFASLKNAGTEKLYINDQGDIYNQQTKKDVWTRMADTPNTVGGSYAGGPLIYTGGDYIYAPRGNCTTDFYRYSISSNLWTAMTVAPNIICNGGSATYTGGDYIYVLRGTNTTDFYRYSISGNSWIAMASTPNGMYGDNHLITYTGGDYIYALRGAGTTDFYRYSISGNSWTSMTVAPDTVGSGWSGGSLVYSAGDYIYALRGGGATTFWRYSISSNSWVVMTSTPAGTSAGASPTYTGGDYIYALRGDTTTDFYRYSISSNSWITMTSAPRTIGSGGSLVYTGDYLYALIGYNNSYFYRYSLGSDTGYDKSVSAGLMLRGNINAESNVTFVSQPTTGNALSLTATTTGTGLTVTQSGTGDIVDLVGDAITSGTGLALSVDGLVNGKGFSITSTSTALTTGKLFSLDWSPGSAATSTGDLFNINIGANGTAGNLFNITDNGSSLFSVSESVITSSLPHSFTSAGDVSMAYDLLFTNQTGSYIKSNAPLYLEAGELFESNDLTLKTYNQGSVVVDSSATTGTSMSISSGSLTTGTGLALTADSLTTGIGLVLSADGLITGTGVDISSTSIAGGASGVSKLLNLSRSGTNTNASHTAYGLYSSVTNTGTTSINIGGYFTASGATNNYGLIVENGNVGIGTATPGSKLDVLENSAGTAFTATQSGTGAIVDFKDSTTSVFKISDGGNITASEFNNIIYVDGTKYTADSPGIQNAIDDLPSTGGKVIIPEGTYNVDRAMDACVASDGGVMTTETTACNNATANDITLLPAVPASNDAYYFGYDYRTRKVTVNMGTPGVGTWTLTWEYYNGSAWTALAAVTDGTTNFTAAAGERDVTYTYPTDWAQTSVNSLTKYWIRARVSAYTSVTTQPLGTQAYGKGSIVIDKSYVTLEGVGDASKLYLSNSANVTVIEVGNGSTAYSNITISSLQVDGNNANNSDGFGVSLSANVTYAMVNTVYIKNTRNKAISNIGSDNKIINNNINLTGIHSDGIYVESLRNIIQENYIVSTQAYQSGISVITGDYNTINNNHISGFGDGINLYNSADNNVISGNSVVSSFGDGIDLGYSNKNTVSGNSIKSNALTGIIITGASRNIIDSNVVEGNGTGATKYNGIYVYSNSDSYHTDKNIISNNSVYANGGAAKYQISIGPTVATYANNNQITGNMVDIGSTGSGTINDGGTNTQISGNYTGTAGEGLFHTQANSTSTALTVTQSGTGNIVDLVGDAVTTGTGMALSADGLTTGTAADISSTSTAGEASGVSKLLNLSRSGVNANASHTAYGLYSSVTDTGTTSTNIGGYFTASGATNNYGLIVASGNVGIGTTAPTSLLNLKGTLTSALTGTVSVTINTAAVTGSGTLFTTELATGDSIKIGSEIFTVSAIASATSLTLDSNHTAGVSGVIAYRDPSLFTIDNGDAVNKFTITRSGNVGIGTATLSSVLTISASGDLAFGDINANLIDNMESIADWTASDGTNTPVALESVYIRDGAGAMKITTVAASSNTDYVRKTFSANQDWSSFERVGFWIKGTVAGQIISFKFYDTGTTTSTHSITIAEANSWQYEEYDISGITSTDRDAVSWAEFYIDDDTGSPTFYIDQVRVYDSDERSSELFVDNEGNLVVWGRGGIELGRGVPGSSLSSMKIGSANIEINQPLNVNVAGDTGMAYDLQFLNTGGANITSQGPLIMSAGDPNKTQNLTLTTQSNQMSGDSGMSTSATGTTLVDSSKAWVTDEWIGGTVYIISGAGYGQERTITDSDATSVTVAAWTVNPDTTSAYRLTYQQGGDVIVDVANSSNNIGGFKIAGMDNGGYVFRVGPDGNVEIGGNGTAGSNLIVKQNLSLIGGNITVSKLATPTGVAVAPVGTAGATTYGYRISAINNNGQTLAAATAQTTTGNATLSSTNYNQITWNAVSGATAYKVYGRTASSELYMYTVSAPNLIFNDIGALTPSGALPSANTTGGDISGILSFFDATNLTLATDTVTVTQTYHTVDEEGTAVDDLSTINGGAAGDILVLRGYDTDYLVTAKDGVGNLKLAGDFAFTSVNDTLTLLFDGTNWLEIARATSGADIAESYYTYDLATEAGDIVSVSSSKGEEKLGDSRNYFVEKTAGKYNSKMLGIVSTSPFVTMGGGYSKLTDESGNILAETKSIALTGRVPAKVNLENGEIKTGDYLTSSSVAGVAMKAAKSGRIIGRALEPFDGTVTECEVELVKMENENASEERQNSAEAEKEKQTVRAVNCMKVSSEIGKVMTFVQPGWYEGEKPVVEWSTESGALSGVTSAIRSGLEDLGAAIDNGILRIKSIFVEDITTKKLCIEGSDGEKICVEKDQLKELLNKNQITPAPDSAEVVPVPAESAVSDVSNETVTPEPSATVAP